MTGFTRVLAMLTVSGALTGFTASIFVPRHYRARAAFVFVRPLHADPATVFERASETTLLPQSLELMIRRSPYFRDRLYVDSIGDLITQTRAGLAIKSTARKAAPGGVIEYEDDDANVALDVASVTLSEFGKNAARISGAKGSAEVIRVVEEPAIHLAGLTPLLLTGFGVAAGLLLSLLIWILVPRRRLVKV